MFYFMTNRSPQDTTPLPLNFRPVPPPALPYTALRHDASEASKAVTREISFDLAYELARWAGADHWHDGALGRDQFCMACDAEGK